MGIKNEEKHNLTKLTKLKFVSGKKLQKYSRKNEARHLGQAHSFQIFTYVEISEKEHAIKNEYLFTSK